MTNELKLTASPRAELGSGAARRLRRKGVLPAVVKRLSGVSEAIGIDAHEFKMAMRRHAGEAVLIRLNLAGQEVPVLLRELQQNAISDEPAHADFGEISLTKKVRVAFNIKLMGEPDGVRNGGGVLQHTMRHVEVECLPTDLIEAIEVDVSTLKLGETLTVAGLKLDKRYTVLTAGTESVAVVSAPDAEEDVGAVTAETSGEPEVIAKGKEEKE